MPAAWKEFNRALLNTGRAASVLSLLVRGEWAKRYGLDASFPAAHSLSLEGMAKRLRDYPRETWVELWKRCEPLLDESEIESVGAVPYLLQPAYLTAVRKQEDPFAFPFRDSGRRELYVSWTDPVLMQSSIRRDIEDLTGRWCQRSKAERGLHPIGPLVEAWLDLPLLVKPDTRQKRILPAGLFPDSALHVVSDAEQQELLVPGATEEVPVQLPLAFRGRGEQLAHVIRPVPLILADAAGFGGTLRGRGARWDKRLLIYALLAMPRGQRRPGGRYSLRRSLRAIVRELFPLGKSGRSNWRPSVHGRKLIAALKALSLARVRMPKGAPYGSWAPALVRGYPDVFDPDSEVRIELALPDECDRGPMIRHPPLVRAGASSDPSFDLWISLAFYWDSAKISNGGHRVYATRPKARRNRRGHLLDGHGSPILRKDGTPVRDWRHKQAVLEGEERHPQADRTPVLTAAQLRTMAYGPRAATGGKPAWEQNRFIKRDLARWQKERRIVVERAGLGWRILECWHEAS